MVNVPGFLTLDGVIGGPMWTFEADAVPPGQTICEGPAPTKIRIGGAP